MTTFVVAFTRQVVLELSELLVALAPECTASNCGQMKVSPLVFILPGEARLAD